MGTRRQDVTLPALNCQYRKALTAVPISSRMPVASTPSTDEREILPPPIAELLTELGTALHKFSIYPDQHPLLQIAVRGIATRLDAVMLGREELAIAVARRQLFVEDAGSDETSPMHRDLAARLHRREIGALRITNGIEEAELHQMLRTLAREQPEGADAEKPPAMPHVELVPLSYDHLTLSDELDQLEDEPVRENWAHALWRKLAHAALARDIVLRDEQDPDKSYTPAEVAKTAVARLEEEGFARRMMGFVSRMMREVRSRGFGGRAAALSSRLSELLRALPPAALERLLRLGRDAKERRQLVEDATHTLPAETVVELARIAAASAQHSMSEAMLLLLAKLARHAEQGEESRREHADQALRENIRQFIDDWDGAANLPEDEYWQTLEKLLGEPVRARHSLDAYRVPAADMVRLGLELEHFGPTMRDAVASMLAEGRVPELIAIMDAAPEQNSIVFSLRRRLENTRTLRLLLAATPVDWGLVERVANRIGAGAVTVLLDVLAETSDRDVATRVAAVVRSFVERALPIIAARLRELPPHAQLALLPIVERIPLWPPELRIKPLLRASAPAVRRAALDLMLRGHPAVSLADRDEAITTAMVDSEPMTVHVALTAAVQHGCPRSAVPLLAQRLESRELTGSNAALAITAIAPVRLPFVLRALLKVCEAPRRRFAFRRTLPPKSPELIAALDALARHWKTESAASRVLARGKRSGDLEIATASRGGRG
jgi:hypothetical protein